MLGKISMNFMLPTIDRRALSEINVSKLDSNPIGSMKQIFSEHTQYIKIETSNIELQC
jgi:hypothetical protein